MMSLKYAGATDREADPSTVAAEKSSPAARRGQRTRNKRHRRGQMQTDAALVRKRPHAATQDDPSSGSASAACHELILGGQRSGKSARAETLARQWLQAEPGHGAVFIATAQARDPEMAQRIQHHQATRRQRLPEMLTIEEPLALADAILQHGRSDCLLVIDCLTLWLNNLHGEFLQAAGVPISDASVWCEAHPALQALLRAIETCPGPLVFVSNEIGLGVVPLGEGVRAYVDALGWLNQQVAQRCTNVCLMVAGQPLHLRSPSPPLPTLSSAQITAPFETIPHLVNALLAAPGATVPRMTDLPSAPLSPVASADAGPASAPHDVSTTSLEPLTGDVRPGTVWFVGAGPGDPDLLTVKGRDLIARAGAILFAGSLVSEAATRWAPAGCEIADSKGMTLEEICHWLSSRALRHQTVIRLQTGDPSLYGALIEMVQPLDEAGIEVRVVPGVSSAFAAAATAVESLTLPEVSQSVIFTRVAGRTPMPDGEDLVSLARHRCTLCIFLSITLLGHIQRDLRAAGWPEDAPILVVHKASWPGEEKIVRATLADIKEACRQARIVSQAMIIASPTTGARHWRSLTHSRLYDASFTHRFRRASRPARDETPVSGHAAPPAEPNHHARLVDMAINKLHAPTTSGGPAATAAGDPSAPKAPNEESGNKDTPHE